jgi:prepilin-type N-terminal cleavage/methylation domain-containing protein
VSTTARAGRRRLAAASCVRPRRGMTLVEVLAAVTILGAALVAMATHVGTFARTVTETDATARAAELAAERLEMVKGATSYASMDSLYTEPTPVAIPGETRYKRQTLIRHVGGGDADLDDYRVVTVMITSPSLRQPLRRTTIVSDF